MCIEMRFINLIIVMTNQIRTTSLSIYNTCPYKFKYWEVNIPIEVSALWDLIHFVSRHPESKKEMIDWYSKEINPDLKTKKIIDKLADKVIQYRQQIDNVYNFVYTEIPFVKKIENTWITWTADLVAIRDSWQSQELLIIDWKTSNNKNWYEWDDIWNESLQSTVYSYLAMEYFWFNKAKFRYVVLEKKSSASLKEFEREFTKEDCLKKIKKVVIEYQNSQDFDDYEPKQNRMCHFCELKEKCPLFKLNVEEWNITESEIKF